MVALDIHLVVCRRAKVASNFLPPTFNSGRVRASNRPIWALELGREGCSKCPGRVRRKACTSTSSVIRHVTRRAMARVGQS